jgi:hypothetical protein
MRGVGHVACVLRDKNAYKILVRKPERKKHLEDLSVDRRIIIECILAK